MTLQTICLRAIVIANSRKLFCPDFGISCGKRTTAEQMQLFTSGKSNCDGIKSISKHQYGFAIDFYAYVDGKANYDPGNMALIATCFLEAASELGKEINWGGNFASLSDCPHIELVSR
jgi:peptidoglycan L-alanyl-D-glutamate endopeptidase CwlK